MSQREAMLPSPLDERNLLFYKIGTIGNAHHDFMPALAEEYDALLLSSDEIRWQLIQERDNKGLDPAKALRVKQDKIKCTIARNAREALKESDVVVDMFCNTEENRASMKKIAHEAGAAAVALWVNTNPRISKARVEAWTEEDSFIVPVSRWGIKPSTAARQIIRNLQKPKEHETDYLLKLDGDRNTEDLTNQVAKKLAALGLVDPDIDLN